MEVGIILIFIGLWLFTRHYLSDKKKPNNCKSMPLAKDYSNYYVYLNDLDEWNDKNYNEYLDFCSKEGKIPIDKKLINVELELRKIRYNNLLK